MMMTTNMISTSIINTSSSLKEEEEKKKTGKKFALHQYYQKIKSTPRLGYEKESRQDEKMSTSSLSTTNPVTNLTITNLAGVSAASGKQTKYICALRSFGMSYFERCYQRYSETRKLRKRQVSPLCHGRGWSQDVAHRGL